MLHVQSYIDQIMKIYIYSCYLIAMEATQHSTRAFINLKGNKSIFFNSYLGCVRYLLIRERIQIKLLLSL